MKARFRFAIAIAVALAIVGAAFAVSNLPPRPSSTTGPPPAPKPSACPRSVGLCSVRNVTRVVDGDTLDVEPNLMIRLVLVNAPELNAAGGPEAKDYLVSLCLGTRALVDEDDNQIGRDPYGRVLAVVTCDGTNANADMISSGLAKTYYMFEILTMLGIGLAFQLPIGLLALQRLGTINASTLTRNWRYAVVIIAVIAAAMPGADPVTTGLEMLPLVLLYLASIVLLKIAPVESTTKTP